jgi:hypothetical protein
LRVGCDLKSAGQLAIDLTDGPRVAAAIVEDRTVGRGRARKHRRRIGLRIVLGIRDEPRGAAGAEEMCDVKLAIGRTPPERAGQLERVRLRQHAGHRRVGRGILAQAEDLIAHGRIADLVAARGRPRDRVGIAVITEGRARLLHRAEPGLLDELIKAARRRGRRGGLRIEVGFDLCCGDEVAEAHAGRRGRLPDRAGKLRACRVDCIRCRGRFDRHVGTGCSRPTRANAFRRSTSSTVVQREWGWLTVG